MDLKQLQQEVGEWSRRNFPDNKPHNPLLGVSEEVGELCHAHLKQEQNIRGLAQDHQCAKEDAVGDIVIYLADYCERNGIDLSAAVTAAWNVVKRRDWQKNRENGTN